MSAISGNTGAVTGGVSAILNTWSATISRAVSEVTSFDNAGRNRLLGVYDMTGSAGGIMSNASAFNSSGQPAALTNITGASLTLQARTGNTIGANVVISSIALGSSKTGDATLSFDFSLASTSTAVTQSPFSITWGP